MNKTTKKVANKYLVEYRGRKIILNQLLVEKQHVDDETIELIKQRHQQRIDRVIEMENTDSISGLVELAKDITEIDYVLQELWGFDADESKHRWFEIPKCTCPHLDNIDLIGTKQRRTSLTCPVHMGMMVKEMCNKIEKTK